MNSAESNHIEQAVCQNDRFCSFVEGHDDFSPLERNYLQSAILSKKLSRILNVSTALAIWSMVAAWMDAIILPSLIIYAISFSGTAYLAIAFPIIWTVFNASSKFIYIRNRLGNAITLRDNVLAVLPYFGAAFLLKNWFIGDPLLRNASLSYIAHRKKSLADRLLIFFRFYRV